MTACHRLSLLDICHPVVLASLLDGAACHPRRVAILNRIGVVTDSIPDPPGRLTSISEMNRHCMFNMPRHNPCRTYSTLAIYGHPKHVSQGDVHVSGVFWANQHDVVPGHLGLWFWQFLQPGVIRVSAVANRRIRPEDHLESRYFLS